MVELEPGVWVQASHVSVVRSFPSQTQVVLKSGWAVTLNNQTPEQVLRKLGLVTQWAHPPGQVHGVHAIIMDDHDTEGELTLRNYA